MLFDSWAGLGRVALVGALAYVGLIIFLRISGKRTLTKLNAFDLVVTVALGSTLATVLLSKDVPLAEGLLALALLIFFQFIIAWASVRYPWFKRVIKSEPTLLFRRGNFLESALLSQRVTHDEVRAVLRSEGLAETADVDAVILETDGSFSVLQSVPDEHASSLKDVPFAVPSDTEPGPRKSGTDGAN